MTKKSKDKKKGKGFREDPDPLLNKAKKHSAVALKNKFKKEPISEEAEIVPTIEEHEDFAVLRFDDSNEFIGILEEFENENDVSLEIEYGDNEVIVEVPAEMKDKFVEFMKENSIEAKDELVEEVIRKIQSKRSDLAIAVDNSKIAENIGDKDDSEVLADWMKAPNRADIRGVDD